MGLFFSSIHLKNALFPVSFHQRRDRNHGCILMLLEFDLHADEHSRFQLSLSIGNFDLNPGLAGFFHQKRRDADDPAAKCLAGKGIGADPLPIPLGFWDNPVQ